MTAELSVWESEGGAPRRRNESARRKNICVTIYDRSGHPFTYNTLAATFGGAIRRAAAWFERHDEQNPRPNKDTVYEVRVRGDVRKWHVCGGTVQAAD